ncbi:serine/threonine protein phosphatase PstP [Gordonia araii NBRC 100433]|uniref:Serine/threonine protein phosphatase PstP n=1 Tax=Gordonia araii NBRC 100433 TaxID=1073574 RepID=G7H6V0_9ACTN|nr:MerR family transcriptional regulator [Gordonia araii]NNG95992.1 MerR family transcriptional regulator [Gordonia araii NBRC 100433]GAB11575.1 serine/threonine protein phosphatase PstP [Gordonia araii NBRC 100433]
MDHMSIGEFARASGLTAKALRHYDELDLLRPADIDAFTGYRRYTHDQMKPARLVAQLRLIGMPLARIRLVLDLAAPMAAIDVAAYWRQVLAETAARGELVQRLLTELRQEEITMSTQHDFVLAAAVRSGRGARESDQDAAYAGRSVFAVADGFGSDVAATRVVDAMASLEDSATDDPDSALRDAVDAAAHSTAADDGGSTLTAMWLHDGRIRVAHVGDSRLWRIRASTVHQLTRDHTLVASLIEDGRLTLDEARAHPHRALLGRALTRGTGDADIAETEALPVTASC